MISRQRLGDLVFTRKVDREPRPGGRFAPITHDAEFGGKYTDAVGVLRVRETLKVAPVRRTEVRAPEARALGVNQRQTFMNQHRIRVLGQAVKVVEDPVPPPPAKVECRGVQPVIGNPLYNNPLLASPFAQVTPRYARIR